MAKAIREECPECPDREAARTQRDCCDKSEQQVGSNGRIMLEISPETAAKLRELTPAVAEWSAGEGQPETGPGDVAALAIAVFHEQVFGRAPRLIEQWRESGADTRH